MDSPSSDPELRERLRMECEIHGTAKLHEKLESLDPERAESIHPNDGVRIIRAIEIIYLSDLRSSDLMKRHGFREMSLNALKLCLHVDREDLYHRINERSVKMADKGLIEETQDLLKQGYSPDLNSMKAIGYRHMIRYLQGEWSLEETIIRLKRDTRRYAKRQLTWFRAEPGVIWVDPNDLDMLIKKINLFLSEST